jgi:hypothetical protein
VAAVVVVAVASCVPESVHSYTAYGFDIRSTFFFPELLPGKKEGRADVAIREDVARADDLRRVEEDEAVLAPQEAYLAFRDVGTCIVRNGRDIVVSRLADSHDAELRLALLGPAFAVLLQQRGFLVLHASAVNVGGRAVAFLGGSGQGKSTIAAALHRRGHPLIVDDLVAVRVGDGPPRVYSGFPQSKLWPDAATALGENCDALPRLHPSYEKRACPLIEGFTTEQSLPLARVFELGVSEAVTIAPMSARDTLMALVRHSYGIEWLHPISGAAQFAQRAEVARCVPAARLDRPYDLTALPAVVEAVEADLVSVS